MSVKFYRNTLFTCKVERYKDKSWCVSYGYEKQSSRASIIENLYAEDIKTWNDMNKFVAHVFRVNSLTTEPIMFRTNGYSQKDPVYLNIVQLCNQ